MNQHIGLGVIGAHAQRGWAKAVHLPALSGSADFRITAVASTRTAQAAEAAAVWGADRAYDDPYRLIADDDVDAVLIAVQLPKRGDLVETALMAGKHVYVEWPLACDAETALRYRDLAAKAGTQHAVGLQTRHHPAIAHLRDLISGGEIGEVLSASLSFSLATPDVWSQRYADLFDKSKGVNHLAVVGGHSMDQFASLIGPFTELSATLATRIPEVTMAETGQRLAVTSPDQILVNGTLESGAAAAVHIMTGGPAGAGYRFEVQGTTGRLVLTSADDSLIGPRYRLSIATGGEPAPLPIPEAYWSGGTDNPGAADNIRRVYAGFARTIRGEGAVAPNFDTAVAVHRTIDAIKRAAESSTRQRV
ncbi:MAG: Gfo/Idh/MocA family protein [Stackebrandtia sp.]